MKIAGIVAEYNPFHTGHAYQIACTRAQLGEDCAVAAVMSGHWVQGGRPAIADKWTRARLALLGGADLVLELPTVWAVSSAETFARGAVELLAAAQVVDVLSFGSECGDADKLRRARLLPQQPGVRGRPAPPCGRGDSPSPPPGRGRWRGCWGRSWPRCCPPPTTTWGWSTCGPWTG